MEKLDQRSKRSTKRKKYQGTSQKNKETYVNIKTEDKPKGKVRGKIKKLTPT